VPISLPHCLVVDGKAGPEMRSNMRTLAIGDIHGCHAALTALLAQVRPQPDDKLIFLGDYIDRGPASRQVIETLLELKELHSPVFLRGNHEVMLLEARADFAESKRWKNYGGLEMLESYAANYDADWPSLIPDAHWKFIEATAKYLETDRHIFVHGSLDADLDMEEQSDRMLYWEYFQLLERHKSGKKIVCGHTRQASGKINDKGFAVCIDTGPANGGWLTCLDVDSGKWWQANEQSETREGELG
jgi:serine/threonine protein phosphatase 1